MSMRYQAGIVLPGYNALKVANAPTIGTATDSATGGSVSVAFTAPSCVGGGAISSYTAYCTTTGTKTTSGASSPLVVTGLTNCTPYAFKVIATNAYGPSYPSAASNSATPTLPVVGQQAYTTAGTYTWVAPAGVTSVSVVTVGAGENPGSGGGALAYKNNISVTPSSSYTVYLSSTGGTDRSYFNNVCTVSAGSKTARTGDGGGDGGAGFGGGAGGYSGAGGTNPSSAGGSNGTAGSGGGGGGGGYSDNAGCLPFSYGAGGGVGILGSGANGAGGTYVGGGSSATGGGGGSGGTAGGNTTPSSSGTGGSYGGARGYGSTAGPGTAGSSAVRIIWPGTTRAFPSTCTGNL